MTASASKLRSHWESAARLIADHRDLLDARPATGVAPVAIASRGWAPFLLACDDAQLDAFEVKGLDVHCPGAMPSSLRSLIERAREVCAIGPIDVAAARPQDGLASTTARRRETPRKHAQVDAFAAVVLERAAKAERVIDVGSGHGHLTRAIAERLGRPVLGLERDGALAERARRLSAFCAGAPAFAETDVLRDGLRLTRGDCVVGLHACGELGDAMVSSASRAAASLVLVGCCLQKRAASARAPLCNGLSVGDALHLPRELLGLSNLTPRDAGVETTRAENLAGRERRLALHRLLCADGRAIRLGAEIEGLNRRSAQLDLVTLVARAFAVRGRPAPHAAAVLEAATWARVEHARMRRLSVPRAMLARVLEVFVLVDRARYLEEHGHVVEVGTLFGQGVSARNLVVVAVPAG